MAKGQLQDVTNLKRAAEDLRAQKVAALRTRNYVSVGVDTAGRIVVEVDSNNYQEPELYWRVWGTSWPVVMSDRFNPNKLLKEQFEFRSREC